MPLDDLNDPLGVQPEKVNAPRIFLWVKLVLPVLGLALGIGVVWRSAGNLPNQAVAKIQHPKLPPVVAVVASPLAPIGTDVTGTIANSARQSGQEAEVRSGVKVVRNGDGLPPGALIIKVPQRLGVQLTPAPDHRLVQKSAFGLLPKTGADGSRAAEIYARPLITLGKLPSNAPRIAILVGGLGLNGALTQEAVSELPGEVSLGFAPYGDGLQLQVNRARSDGHEVLLQAPMEPFDYARNNPGPHTLLTTNSAAHTMDDLQWMMGRFVGYVGVESFLGAKFTADRSALNSVLSEIESRGLSFVDDGSSPQSLARDGAANMSLPFTRADVVIDADPNPTAISAALERLITLARIKGSALGSATGFPASIRKIASFTKTLKREGITLVPVSALTSRVSKLDAENQ